MSTVLEMARAARAAITEPAAAVIALAETENRDLTGPEFDVVAAAAANPDAAALDARITALESVQIRQADSAHTPGIGGARVRREQRTYTSHANTHENVSFFSDAYNSKHNDNPAARARLERHVNEARA